MNDIDDEDLDAGLDLIKLKVTEAEAAEAGVSCDMGESADSARSADEEPGPEEPQERLSGDATPPPSPRSHGDGPDSPSFWL